MKRDGIEKERVTFYLTSEDHRTLKIAAAERGLTMSAMVGVLIAEHLELSDDAKETLLHLATSSGLTVPKLIERMLESQGRVTAARRA